MTAPDPDRRSDDAPIPPEALAAGQRTLAAIVFTDTVGFSKLMSKDEERTLRLVARDLEHMKAVCGAFGGQVLKSTGDGLLMLFTSAVQAVACALEIQRDIQKQNLELPKTDRLQHRIGIHLGDVFQHGGDVMGDGVNIAARLQTEAVPGGICLSQTVYDVVHNRLPFYVNDLGPRKLKNIGTVTAYQISPTDGGRRYLHQVRSWLKAGFVVFLVLAVLLITYRLGVKRQRVDDDLVKIAHELNPSGPSLTTQPKAASPIAQATNVEVVAPPQGPYPENGKLAASDAEFELARFNYMNKYNFGAMCAWLEKYDSPSADEDKLDVVCKSMRALFGWCTIELQNYSEQNPLRVHSDRDNQNYEFWPEPSGGVMFKSPTGILALPREQIPPVAMAGIAAQLIRENGKPGQPSTLHLWRGVKFFVETYHVKLSPRWQQELDEFSAQDTASVGPQ